MISAKLAKKAYVMGGVFQRGDYLSRVWWLGGEIKEMTLVGQTSMNVQMSNISKPTYDKVLAKVKKKGYKIQCKIQNPLYYLEGTEASPCFFLRHHHRQ